MKEFVKVIYDKCIGCGKCFAICPEIFTFDDEGIAIVKEDISQIDDDILQRCTEAKNICPTHAIKIKK